jgi:hypothetical protein
MASVQTLMQEYDRHLARLEQLRGLLEERLAAARSEGNAKWRIAAIEAAIERMDRGRYGICRRCGAVIAFGALSRAPQRQLCEGCGESAG